MTSECGGKVQAQQRKIRTRHTAPGAGDPRKKEDRTADPDKVKPRVRRGDQHRGKQQLFQRFQPFSRPREIDNF